MNNADFDTPHPKSSGPPGDPGSPVQAIESPQKPGLSTPNPRNPATHHQLTVAKRQPAVLWTAQTPVSTGHSPSGQLVLEGPFRRAAPPGEGCGSSEGTRAWRSCDARDNVIVVAGFVDVVSFLGEVVVPVRVEVTVGFDGAEFEDGFGAGESPAGAGDVHPVLD